MSQYESEFFLLFSSQGHTRWTDEGGKWIQMILKKIGVLARTNLTEYCEKMLNLSIFILCPSFFFMYKRMKWVTIVFCAHQASLVSWFVPTLSHKRRSRGSVHEHDNAIAWKKRGFLSKKMFPLSLCGGRDKCVSFVGRLWLLKEKKDYFLSLGCEASFTSHLLSSDLATLACLTGILCRRHRYTCFTALISGNHLEEGDHWQACKWKCIFLIAANFSNWMLLFPWREGHRSNFKNCE